MSAELLRRAAALMRGRAQEATPGPWGVAQDEDSGEMYIVGAREIALVYEWSTGLGNPHHIASWHPAVALAVADWLEAAAQDREDQPYLPQWWDELSLAVARAYLGEEAPR